MKTLKEAAKTLISALREWAALETPMIGHHSLDAASYGRAARAMQDTARQMAERIEAMAEDEMEANFIAHWLHNSVANMDAHGLIGVGRAAQHCFNSAINRRDERHGLRRGPRGFRQLGTANGH